MESLLKFYRHEDCKLLQDELKHGKKFHLSTDFFTKHGLKRTTMWNLESLKDAETLRKTMENILKISVDSDLDQAFRALVHMYTLLEISVIDVKGELYQLSVNYDDGCTVLLK